MKSQNCRNQGLSYYLRLMIEGSGAGSVPRSNGSGFATLLIEEQFACHNQLRGELSLFQLIKKQHPDFQLFTAPIFGNMFQNCLLRLCKLPTKEQAAL
jgi:hypothetical protein